MIDDPQSALREPKAYYARFHPLPANNDMNQVHQTLKVLAQAGRVHLETEEIDALAYALDQFEGTLIFISHDVYFIRALSNHVVHVNAGQLTHYPGGYQYYLDKTKALSARAALTAGSNSGSASPKKSAPKTAVDRKEQKRLEAEQRQARSRGSREQKQLVHNLEKKIQDLERKQTELTAELEKQETYEQPGRAMQINRDLVEVQHELAALNPEWEKQAARLAELEVN